MLNKTDTAGNKARKGKPKPDVNIEGVALRDFYAVMPSHCYIFTPTGEKWPASSVNSRVPPVPLLKNGQPILSDTGEPVTMIASQWLDRYRAVEQMTWAPGKPLEIEDYLISEGGWIYRKSVSILNLYRPPIIKPGNSGEVQPWLDLLAKVYPDDTDHILNFFAHRVQHPEEKINHGLILGGNPRIGKDSLVEPLKHAVGPWNCKEISPREMLEPYNDFMKAVVLRISEARDLGEISRYTFYDAMKTVLATPPDTVRINTKYIAQHYVLNICGVIITTNYKTNGIYLPPDDSRSYVAWSQTSEGDFEEGYFPKLWGWYAKHGLANIAAYLAERDLSTFNPKASPKKTAAFWAIVDANMAPEQSELADVLDEVGNGRKVDAITLIIVTGHATGAFQEWLLDRKNRRVIPHRFEQCGYVPVRNNGASDGLWVHNGKRQVIYARAELSLRQQIEAANALIKEGIR